MRKLALATGFILISTTANATCTVSAAKQEKRQIIFPVEMTTGSTCIIFERNNETLHSYLSKLEKISIPVLSTHLGKLRHDYYVNPKNPQDLKTSRDRYIYKSARKPGIEEITFHANDSSSAGYEDIVYRINITKP